MARVILDDSSKLENIRFDWEKIAHSLEPELAKLPKKDRRYFQSMVKLIIGKEIRLSNIPPKHIYTYFKRGDLVLDTMRYPQYVDAEFIRTQFAKLLYRLGIRISEDALGWRYGPMGFQQSKVIQEVHGIPTTTGGQG